MPHNRTFWIKAKAGAENAINMLQSVIPNKLEQGHKSVCWNTTFLAILGSDGILSGSIGDQSFYIDVSSSTDFLDPRHYYLRMLKEETGIMNSDGLYSTRICIPRVFLAGFPKSGSTALDNTLTVHPNIHHGLSKEPRWWTPPFIHPNRYPFKANINYFVKYLLQYNYRTMQAHPHDDILLLDSSPNLLARWSNIGYEEDYEDVCLIPTVLSITIPKPQFIIILRNPIEFLYSTFWFHCSSKVYRDYNLTEIQARRGPYVFHAIVLDRVADFRKCSQTNPTEKCVLEQALVQDKHPNSFPCGHVPLGFAVYYVHIMKWFSLFPRRSFFFVTSEEFFQAPFRTTQKIWDFLDVPQPKLNYIFLSKRLQRSQNTQTHFDYRHDRELQMLPQTRILLREFLKPFNAILSSLLNSDKYLWKA